MTSVILANLQIAGVLTALCVLSTVGSASVSQSGEPATPPLANFASKTDTVSSMRIAIHDNKLNASSID